MQYAWDADNRLQSVTDVRTNGVTNYSFDQTNQLAAFAYPNGVQHAFTYDNRDRATALSVAKAGTVLASYSQTFSDSSHKLSVVENSGRAANYSYDPIYRLLTETVSGSSVNGLLSYTLDPVGNRLGLTSTIAPLPSQNVSYDADDRLTADTYDSNGNTLTSVGVNYGYEFEDRLISTSTGVQILYDGDGNRVGRAQAGTVVRYLIDDQTPTHYAQVAEEVVGGSVTAQFTYGTMRISQNRAGSVSYYGYDAGGSVRELLNATGAITDTYSYDAFGNTVAQTGSTVNQVLYRGEQFDAGLGIYYLRARYYVPRTGRFLTADKYEGGETDSCDCLTVKAKAVYLGAHHLFEYSAADPVGRIDPTGQANILEWGLTKLGFSAEAVELISVAHETFTSICVGTELMAQALGNGGHEGALYTFEQLPAILHATCAVLGAGLIPAL